jgi:hypothetical protein
MHPLSHAPAWHRKGLLNRTLCILPDAAKNDPYLLLRDFHRRTTRNPAIATGQKNAGPRWVRHLSPYARG